MPNPVVFALIIILCAVVINLYVLSWIYFPVYAGIFSVVICFFVWAKKYQQNQKDKIRGWRFCGRGRDSFKYGEWRNEIWHEIPIGGEMLTTRRPAHLIYLPSVDEWGQFPDWAKNRRAEIISRIKVLRPPPKYEYHGE